MAGRTKSHSPAERLARFNSFHNKHDDNAGLIINQRYWLRHLIGAGGMGKVYSAVDQADNSEVVVKIRDKRTHKRVSRKRITSEINALKQINHPNIVTLRDAGTFMGTNPLSGGLCEIAFEVMELMVGVDLGKYLDSMKTLQWASAKSIISQSCDGLGAMHGNGIIHHDIKPENIFIVENGTVKIFDFDLTRFCSLDPQDEVPPGTFYGTLNYLSPEKIINGKADHRSDLFSLGIVLYEMLTGRLPFRSPRMIEIAARILNEQPAPVTQAAPWLGAAKKIERIVMRALEKDPDKRYQSAKEMKHDVLEVADQSPVMVRHMPMEMQSSDSWKDFLGRMSTFPIVPQDTAPMQA